MQLSGDGRRYRVFFRTITILDIGFVGCFDDGVSLLVLLSLAFVIAALSVVVLALAFSGVAFAFAFPPAALSVTSLSIVGGVDTAAGIESFATAAGRIRG